MKFFIKWFKAFDQLLKVKKSVWKLLFAFLFVALLFLAPFFLIFFNALIIYNNKSSIILFLIIMMPFYFQFCIGLICSYFYELMAPNIEIDLTKKEAFLGGLAFFPTIVIMIALVIVLIIL